MSDEVEVTDVDLSDEQVEEVESPEVELSDLDIETYRNHQVSVKVGGIDQRVSVDEAVAGYQRQADYTQKTQELATQRSELQWAAAIRGALDNDPQGTLDLLSQHYGLGPKVAQQEEESSWGEPAVDPRYSQLEQRLARFEEAQATADLHKEVARLQTQYGEDFNPQEVVAEALKRGSTDLEGTFKLVAFDRLVGKGRTDGVAKQAAAAATAAKKVASLASGGTTVHTAGADPSPIFSISDAYHAAKRSLGA